MRLWTNEHVVSSELVELLEIPNLPTELKQEILKACGEVDSQGAVSYPTKARVEFYIHKYQGFFGELIRRKQPQVKRTVGPDKEVNLETLELTRRAVEAASEKQASDIVLLDARDFCHFADYIMICSADSKRQLKTVSGAIEDSLDKMGAAFHHREGTAESGWVLLDYGDVIIHVFSVAKREFYEFDQFCRDARLVLQIQ